MFDAAASFEADHIEITIQIVCVTERECIFAVIDGEDFGIELATGSCKRKDSFMCAVECGVFGVFASLGSFEEDPNNGI